MSHTVGHWLLLFVAMLASGCAGGTTLPDLVPVTGTVTYAGQPLEQGLIIFEPADPGIGQPATGRIEAGEFKMLTSVSSPGIVAGSYKVRIESREQLAEEDRPDLTKEYTPPVLASLIPERYSRFETSELETDVVAGMGPLRFDLEEE